MSLSETFTIIQRQFVISAPQQRVWDLLGKAIYQGMPFEKMDIVNERLFYADMIWKFAFIRLKFHTKVEFTNISPPNLMACTISVNKGLIKLKFEVTFSLRGMYQNKTEVSYSMTEETKKGMLLRSTTKRQLQGFAGNMFNSIRTRLEDYAC